MRLKPYCRGVVWKSGVRSRKPWRALVVDEDSVDEILTKGYSTMEAAKRAAQLEVDRRGWMMDEKWDEGEETGDS